MIRKLAVASMLLSSMNLLYAEEKKVEQGVWKGSAELGLIFSSGNTETDTINGKAKIGTERGKWRYTGELSTLKTSDTTGTTAEKYDLKLQSDYKYAEFEYLFAIYTYEDVRFSGYDYRMGESVGYGRRVFHESNMSLDLEVGPGARQSELSSGTSESEFTIRGAAKYGWDITKTSRFSEEFTLEVGEDSTISKSVTALSTNINGDLAMKVSYTLKHASEVPPTFEKTDTELAVTLVYSY